MVSIDELYNIYLRYPLICTDTRAIEANSIFFALKGKNFNGNTFAERAIKSGSTYAVIDEPNFKLNDQFILVKNTLKSLQELASFHRKKLNIPVIGITGSNGKTTTKELIYEVLKRKYNVLATKGNLNNPIGVPLTILRINRQHTMAVIEMGANHKNEIKDLCSISQPNSGLITNIGKAHLEGFGGYPGVISAKNELYQHLVEKNGTAFVNFNNTLLVELSKPIKNIVTYGTTKDCMYYGSAFSAFPYLNIRWNRKKDPYQNDNFISTQLFGKYNLENIIAAICIGGHFNVESEDIKTAIENYCPSNRSQILKKGSNTILLDAYNANATSMYEVLKEFGELDIRNKIVFLGDMLELGDESKTEHENILNLIKESDFKDSIVVGKRFCSVVNNTSTKCFETIDKAKEWTINQKFNNAYILIKGSREIRMEKILEAIT